MRGDFAARRTRVTPLTMASLALPETLIRGVSAASHRCSHLGGMRMFNAVRAGRRGHEADAYSPTMQPTIEILIDQGEREIGMEITLKTCHHYLAARTGHASMHNCPQTAAAQLRLMPGLLRSPAVPASASEHRPLRGVSDMNWQR